MSSRPLDAQLLRFVGALTDAVLFSMGELVVGCNDQACAMLGYSREELTGLPRSAVIPTTDPRLAQAIAQRKQTGSFHGQVGLKKKDGGTLDVEMTSVTLTSGDGTEVVCAVLHDLGDRRRAEQANAALKESNELLHALSDAAFEGVLIHQQGVIQVANRAAEVMARVGPGELHGKKLLDFIAPQSIPQVMARVAQNDEQPYSAFGQRSDGTVYPVEAQGRTGPVQVHGSPARVVAIRDVSDRVALEEQFHQAQKMEAIGQLAGGVAHDFNNLLTVIMGAASLAESTVSGGHAATPYLQEVLRAAESAASLTRQLLAFSRKQVLQPRVMDLDQTVTRVESMIRRLVGEDIALRVQTRAEGHLIKADPGQIENVVMNLVVNARDSMPDGGTLTITTGHVMLDADWARSHLETRPGHHVQLSITDTGQGMDAATRARIFEPFFTTKGPGRGTGLGLSTVFGIVKQAGGSIWVDSSPGKGTTFTIYLPVTTEAPAPALSSGVGPRPQTKAGTILLVEDEPQLLEVAATVLQQAGFEVLRAAGGPAALELLARHPGPLDLLITDVVMPGMNGKQVADAVQQQRPGLKVLFMSGYTEHSIVHQSVVDAGIDFLPKPFTPAALLSMIHDVLD